MSLLGIYPKEIMYVIAMTFSEVSPIILAILGIVVAIVVVRFIFNFIRSRLSN